jgi:hypothetical protein
MTGELFPVVLEQLRPTWAKVRDRVAEISERWSQPWIADDVFHELLVGNAHLWALEDCSGFMVLRVFATAYERTLHVWIADNASEARIADYLEQVRAIAEDNGCSRITWESDRRYHRALPGVRVAYAYSIDVGD